MGVLETCKKCGDESWDGLCTNCQAYELDRIRTALKVDADADLAEQTRKVMKQLDAIRELLSLPPGSDLVESVKAMKDLLAKACDDVSYTDAIQGLVPWYEPACAVLKIQPVVRCAAPAEPTKGKE